MNDMTVPEAALKGDATVKTFDRAARVLRVLAAAGPQGLALRQVSDLSQLGKPTTHRLLGALIEAGFAYQEPATRNYRIGAGLGALSRLAHQYDFAALSQPYVAFLAQETGDTAYASVREGNAAVCVAREIGAYPIRTLSLDVGHRRPLGVGSGPLAILSRLSDAEIDQSLQLNAPWLAAFAGLDDASIRTAAHEARRYGFSFVDGRILPGMNAIGVPVHDGNGQVIGALSLSAIAGRISGERVASLAGLLKEQAGDLSRQCAATLDGPARPPVASRRGAPKVRNSEFIF